MKNKDLINKLQKYKDTTEVCVEYYGKYSIIEEDIVHVVYDDGKIKLFTV